MTNPNGTATTPTAFKLLPKITGFTPPMAALESTVVVSGTNLKTGSTDPVVKVGTTTARWSHRLRLPLLAVTAKISITTADGTVTSVAVVTVTP